MYHLSEDKIDRFKCKIHAKIFPDIDKSINVKISFE